MSFIFFSFSWSIVLLLLLVLACVGSSLSVEVWLTMQLLMQAALMFSDVPADGYSGLDMRH
jgi:hypothetical protein